MPKLFFDYNTENNVEHRFLVEHQTDKELAQAVRSVDLDPENHIVTVEYSQYYFMPTEGMIGEEKEVDKDKLGKEKNLAIHVLDPTGNSVGMYLLIDMDLKEKYGYNVVYTFKDAKQWRKEDDKAKEEENV